MSKSKEEMKEIAGNIHCGMREVDDVDAERANFTVQNANKYADLMEQMRKIMKALEISKSITGKQFNDIIKSEEASSRPMTTPVPEQSSINPKAKPKIPRMKKKQEATDVSLGSDQSYYSPEQSDENTVTSETGAQRRGASAGSTMETVIGIPITVPEGDGSDQGFWSDKRLAR